MTLSPDDADRDRPGDVLADLVDGEIPRQRSVHSE